ncbi:MAG: FimV/HubP family polar landmark protein [Gammaproteobacteria bacterium]|nr:FimV/HubP family polar landmark protein [Gammaproteobacteria bacterium]
MRRLARISTALLLLTPLNATSLGLGDIQLRSALNEPLDARIGLNALGQTGVHDIAVALASRDTFGQVGLDRPAFLSDLKFSVEADEQGRPAILVTSSQPISEPFLDFLVELNWPNGRLLREYTVLLDPPLLLDEAPEPILAATSAGAAPRSQTVSDAAPAAASTTRTSSAPMMGARAQVTAEGGWNYGPVARDATLWSIAQELQQLGGGYSVEQIMMALLRDNPEAFYNGNVNELRAGHVLRIDDPASIGAISRAAAIAEHRRQTEQWMDAKRGVAGQVADRPMGSGSAAVDAGPAAAAGADGGPRLRLSAPEAMDEGSLVGGTNEGEAESADAQRLRQELAVALEVSEAARQENVELRERLAALEEQIASMQRLLSLRDDALTAMQANADGAAPAAPVQQPAEAGSKSNPWTALLNDPMMLGLGGGALLLFATLGWLIARRRQLARAAIEEFAAQPAPRYREEAGTAAAVATTIAAAGSAAAAELEPEAELDEAAGEAANAGMDIMQADEDEIDILAEADVYLAYRRFDKAEELLKQAIQEDPRRNDLVLKLLEVFAASGNAEAFALQAEALQAGLGESDAGLWDKVVVMGRRVAPQHALFAAQPQQADSGTEPAIDELDLDNFDFSRFDETADLAADEADPFGIGGNESADALQAVAGEDAAEPVAAEPVMEAASFETAGEYMIDGSEVATGTETGDVSGQAAGDEFVLHEAEADPDMVATSDDSVRPASLGDFASTPASTGISTEDDTAAVASSSATDIDWLSAVGDDLAAFEVDLLGDEEGEYDGLVSGTDEVGTKLDLAKAYIDMGDQESALSILDEVSEDGSEDQQREASALKRQIG